MSDVLKKGRRTEKIIIAVTAVAVIAAVVFLFVFRRPEPDVSAVTMRVLRFEGDVFLRENGESKTVTENLRLAGGDVVDTAERSEVNIGLDEHKIVSLREKSRAAIEKEGKKLELSLEKGILDFEVSKHLDDDETFEIRTYTMVVGIRGTAGEVYTSDDSEGVTIYDGTVHVVATNPDTGETKEVDVTAGQKIVVRTPDEGEESLVIEFEEAGAGQRPLLGEPAQGEATDDVSGTGPLEAVDGSYEEEFELVEVSDEIKNSRMGDGTYQIGKAVINVIDNPMTFREFVDRLSINGEVTLSEEYPMETVIGGEIIELDVRPEGAPEKYGMCKVQLGWSGGALMDAQITSYIYSIPDSPYCMNFFYPGNICGMMEVSGRREMFKDLYKTAVEKRLEEYPYWNMDYEECKEYWTEKCSHEEIWPGFYREGDITTISLPNSSAGYDHKQNRTLKFSPGYNAG